MIDKNSTMATAAAFTGHRMVPSARRAELSKILRKRIISLYKEGVKDFLCGMAWGFDLIAAEEVIRLKATLPSIRLVAIVPWRGQSAGWDEYRRMQYDRIIAQADVVKVLSECYFNVSSTN